MILNNIQIFINVYNQKYLTGKKLPKFKKNQIKKKSIIKQNSNNGEE
jgi:hypothetical protein